MKHPATGYRIAEDGRSITCLSCGLTSHNAEDVSQRFCGRCHVFHDDAVEPAVTPPVPGERPMNEKICYTDFLRISPVLTGLLRSFVCFSFSIASLVDIGYTNEIKDLPQIFPGSSVVEQAAVNRLAGGSNPLPGSQL